MYNKTFVGILIADIYNDTYIQSDIDTLIPNTDLSNHYIKTKFGTIFSNIDVTNYCTKSEVDGIDNELSTLILNTYTKTEADTLIYTNYNSLSFIVYNFDSKTETAPTLSDYTTTTQLDYDFHSKGYVNQVLIQSTTLFLILLYERRPR